MTLEEVKQLPFFTEFTQEINSLPNAYGWELQLTKRELTIIKDALILLLKECGEQETQLEIAELCLEASAELQEQKTWK